MKEKAAEKILREFVPYFKKHHNSLIEAAFEQYVPNFKQLQEHIETFNEKIDEMRFSWGLFGPFDDSNYIVWLEDSFPHQMVSIPEKHILFSRIFSTLTYKFRVGITLFDGKCILRAFYHETPDRTLSAQLIFSDIFSDENLDKLMKNIRYLSGVDYFSKNE